MEHTIKRRKTNWIGHIWRRNSHLKHVTGGNTERMKEGMSKGEKRCRRLRMTLIKRDLGILRKKHYIALTEELASEEFMDLSQDGLCNEQAYSVIRPSDKYSNIPDEEQDFILA